MRVKLKKKKEKNLEKTSPRIFLLEFTNESLLGLILKIKKKKRRGKKKKKTFVSLPRKKDAILRIRNGWDKARIGYYTGWNYAGRKKERRDEGAAFFLLFFLIWRGSVKAVEGGDKPQKTTARVVAVTDYAVPQRFTVWRIKGGGKGGREKREVAG